ncbi:MAG: hypothetical protein F6K42_10170 [Leptolyngbya sp. SIO1D8]|nr:hypothetical protein [Leptolyngbya sp. SIO1D8]
MKDFPIRNIFLPAALVASSVFSAFTVPAALKQSTDAPVQALPVFSQAAQVSLNRLHKDVAIPYIGTAIVFSASAGILTAELARKRYSARQRLAAQKAEFNSYVGSHETIGYSSMTAESDSLLAGLPISNSSLEWPTTENIEGDTASEKTGTEYHFPEQMAEAAWPEPAHPEESSEGDQEIDRTVVIFPGQYERCRIQVPHRQEQLYAIEFDGEFYSLLSAGISKEQALAAINQLTQDDCAAILTQMNQGYAIWVLESEAELASVA